MATGEETHKVFSIRVETELLARIDYDAERMGLSRTQYVLGMLPETYDTTMGKQRAAQDKAGR